MLYFFLLIRCDLLPVPPSHAPSISVIVLLHRQVGDDGDQRCGRDHQPGERPRRPAVAAGLVAGAADLRVKVTNLLIAEFHVINLLPGCPITKAGQRR